MRVAFDVGPLGQEPTGVGIFVAELAGALAARLDDGELRFVGRRDLTAGLPASPRTTRMRPAVYLGWLQTLAAVDVRRSGATVAHFSDGLAPTLKAARTVVSIHDMSVVRAWRTHPLRRLARVPFALLAPRLADVITVPSVATADEVRRLTGVPSKKIEIVPYAARSAFGAGTTSDRSLPHGLSAGGYVLTIGTIEPRKNHERLIHAFELAIADGGLPNGTQLAIAGRVGWRAQPILLRVASSPMAQRIKLLGYVSDLDLASLITRAAAVAYPSLYEGFGLPVVEAMALGAPTVTSNLSSMPEVAGDAGFLVDPFDPRDIARGLTAAVRAGMTDRAGTAARARAQAATFSWTRTAASMIDIYRSLAG